MSLTAARWCGTWLVERVWCSDGKKEVDGTKEVDSARNATNIGDKQQTEIEEKIL
jgi:hypothetical protein